MKNILLILFCSFSLSVFAQNEGIDFVKKGNWDDMLEMAQEKDKLIFVDAYTTWCGPCKWMDANVFNLKAIGDYYNEHFINVKLDMEKGDGLLVAEKYKVNAYPTFLFINGDGVLVHRSTGMQETPAFLELGTAAVDPDRQYGALKSRYGKGERSEDMLKNFAVAAREAYDDNYNQAVKEYLATQEDWTTKENVEFIYDFLPSNLNTELFQFFLKNREHFDRSFGEEEIDARIQYAAQMTAVGDNELSVERIEKEYHLLFEKEKADRLSAEFAMHYYMDWPEKEAFPKFKNAAIKYLSNYGDQVTEWRTFNSVAWRFYEGEDEEKMLLKALDWGKQSIEIESNYYNNDTVAALHFKLGNYDKAMEYAEKAINKAKEVGEDPDATRQLIKRINAMK